MSSSQENSTDITSEVSALHCVRHASGYSRLIYGAYLTLGVIFYGMGIYTALGILMRSLNGGSVLSFATILLLCYVLLNSIIGYGFIFYRKWLLTAFVSALILTGFLAMFFFSNGTMFRAAQLLTSIFMIGGISLFLFLTKHVLSDRYFEPRAVIPFAGALLVSFLLTNLGMLH